MGVATALPIAAKRQPSLAGRSERRTRMPGIRRMLIAAGATLMGVGMFSGSAWGASSPPKAQVTASAAAQMTPIATGLDNPRDIAIAPWGSGVYVAEAGHGAEPGSKDCIPPEEAGEEPTCVGF